MVQVGLENPISMRRATLRLASRRHGDEARGHTKQEPHSEIDSEEDYNGTDNGIDNIYIANKNGTPHRLWALPHVFGKMVRLQ